jgi:rare lipoprotein A
VTSQAVLRISLLSLVSVLAAACASDQRQSESRVLGDPIINPPRSERGNPPFYEVFGERYYILSTSDGYRGAGTASWYGVDFHGKETSSGETYDMYAYTAAHRTLPIPTWVEVTNRANGRTVIVRVNDRGPFVDDRIIDLSYAAALDLDMIRTGTVPVYVRALGAPASFPEAETIERRAKSGETTPVPRADIATVAAGRPASRINETVPEIASRPASAGAFVQVGAFSDIGNAERLVRRLRNNGFANTFLVSDDSSRPAIHRVRIGPIDALLDFDFIDDSLRLLGIRDARLIHDP